MLCYVTKYFKIGSRKFSALNFANSDKSNFLMAFHIYSSLDKVPTYTVTLLHLCRTSQFCKCKATMKIRLFPLTT